MALEKNGNLSKCNSPLNCVYETWEFVNVNQAFDKVILISENLPRTTVKEKTNIYWKGICKSKVFKFPDELEILKIPSKGLINIKSSSIYGAFDFFANRLRVNFIYRKLMSNSK